MADVVLCAVSLEFKLLCEAAHGERQSFAGRRFYAEIAPGWVAVQAGIGKALAAAGAEAAITHFKPKRILEFGGAGALDLNLKIGQLIAASEAVEHDAPGLDGKNPRFPLKIFFEIENAVTGVIACGDQVIVTREERALLSKKTGASIVTMESSAVARISRIHGVDFASLRVITDAGDTSDIMAEFKSGAKKTLRPAAEALLRAFQRG